MFAIGRFLRIPGPWFVTRWIRRIALGLAAAYLAGTFLQVWFAAGHDDVPVRADAIVVLGAAQYNGRPSAVLRSRLDHALVLYRSDVAPLIIVTGGRQAGDRMTEASASARYLIAHGVPDARIKREVQGTNTWESLAASARFLRRDGVHEVVLVSSGFHAARLAATAHEVGLSPHVSPTGGRGSLRVLAREAAAVAVGRIIGYRRLSGLS